jgi:hypothetical protein
MFDQFNKVYTKWVIFAIRKDDSRMNAGPGAFY